MHILQDKLQYANAEAHSYTLIQTAWRGERKGLRKAAQGHTEVSLGSVQCAIQQSLNVYTS